MVPMWLWLVCGAFGASAVVLACAAWAVCAITDGEFGDEAGEGTED